jgi:nitrogen fixation NifU-like protein
VDTNEIIDRARNPHFAGTVIAPTHTAEGANLSCGDEITWQLSVTDSGTISAIAHQTRACTICTCCADLLAEAAVGKQISEVLTWDISMQSRQLTLPLSPMRLKCAVLPAETLRLLHPKTDSN